MLPSLQRRDNRQRDTAGNGPVRQPSVLRPAAGTGGDLLPGLFVYLVDIIGQRVSFAALHAAKAYRASTEEQQHFAAAVFALQSYLHMADILAHFSPFGKAYPFSLQWTCRPGTDLV
jgi:hypothetical protein